MVTETLACGDLKLLPDGALVHRDGHAKLRESQQTFAERLMRRAGRIATHDELAQALGVGARSLEGAVRAFQSTLDGLDALHLLVTVWGVGYRLGGGPA